MQVLENQQEEVQDYNEEPVYYCSCCLSLAIRTVETLDYCDSCGNTNIQQLPIEEWEKLYKEKYGKSFINRNKNGRE